VSVIGRLQSWVTPGLPATDDTIQRAVTRSLASTAIQMTKVVAALAPLTAVLWVALLWSRSDHVRLLLWLALITCTAVALLTIAGNHDGGARSARRVTGRLSHALVAAGIGWGSIGVIAMPSEPTWRALVGMMLVATMAANAIFAAAVARMFWSFQVPVAVLGALPFIIRGEAIDWAIASIVLYALPFSAVLARVNRATAQRAAYFAALNRRTAEELKAVNLRLAHEASHDPLTGIPNRQAFGQRLAAAVSKNGEPVAVLFMDLDRFKHINDRFGHETGDKALSIVAGRILSRLRPGDVLARFGGDEFTALIEGPESREDVEQIARRILAAFDEPVHIDGRPHDVGVSIGVAMAPDPIPAAELLRNADSALYAAKHAGRGNYRVYGD
jgi:diguanylate cyclase (GGDEF)-like protein